MDIYEFAMQMEQDGEKFYRELASRTVSQGIRTILLALADDEVKHYHVVEQMRMAAPVTMAATQVLTNAQNVFSRMSGEAVGIDGSQVDLYRQAQDIERQSQTFYEEKAEQVTNPQHRAFFLKIADEEKRHYFLLDAIIEFMARPETWLENAEFNHLGQY
jgi:rubrerythrin